MRSGLSSDGPARRFALVCTLLLCCAPLASHAQDGGTWTVDTNHSQVSFTVKHFMTPVTGSFGQWEMTLVYDAAHPEQSSVKATVQIDSVDTGNGRRDGDLKSPNFFEAEKFPTATFESRSVEVKGENHLVVTGPLTIKGISKDVALEVELLGSVKIPEENQQRMRGTKEVASFRAATTFDRRDFTVGTGNFAATLVVGADVELEILVEADLR